HGPILPGRRYRFEAVIEDRIQSGTRCGRGSVGRASPCQGEGRGFESRRPLGDALGCPSGLPRSLGLPGGVAEWLRQGPAKPCTRVRFPPPPRALSSAGERFPDTEEVTGSIPVAPTSDLGDPCPQRSRTGSLVML